MDQRELAKLAREHSEDALSRLIDVIQNGSNLQMVLKAIDLLFNRAYGKVDKDPLPEGVTEAAGLESMPTKKRVEVLRAALKQEEKKLLGELTEQDVS